MVLEAIMICADNSEPMRNGDYTPTRLEAQAETINYIASNKINGNQETQVGLMTMAGRRLEVHLSPGRNLGSINTCLNKEVKVSGESNFVGALKTAQLVLKNRQNKNQRQRVIMFIGSPLKDDEKTLVRLGKLLKKNNVAVDLVNFGLENATQRAKLEEFIKAVNSGDNSHLVHVPPGPHQLSDMVMISPIMVETAAPSAAAGTGAAARPGAAAAAAGAGSAASTGGAASAGPNYEDDPEYAMAMRVSREEERARQEKLAKERAEAAAAAPAKAAGSSSSSSAATPAADTGAAPMSIDDDEAADLAAAMALSMAASAAPAAGGAATGAGAAGSAAAAPAETPVDIAAALQDPDFMNSLLEQAGVPKEDIAIDDLLNNLTGEPKKEPKKEDPK